MIDDRTAPLHEKLDSIAKEISTLRTKQAVMLSTLETQKTMWERSIIQGQQVDNCETDRRDIWEGINDTKGRVNGVEVKTAAIEQSISAISKQGDRAGRTQALIPGWVIGVLGVLLAIATWAYEVGKG